MNNTYIKLTLGSWTCVHIWDNRMSTKEYEDMGYKVQIINFGKDE